MFRKIRSSCFWPRLCHMKYQNLLSAYGRYRLFEDLHSNTQSQTNDRIE